jgi:hypothetical protein
MKTKWEKWVKALEELNKISKKFLVFITTLNSNLAENTIVCGEWTVKDVVSHIIGWEKETILQFKSFLAGSSKNVRYDMDAFNKKSVELRKHLSWDQVVSELQTAQKELRYLNDSIDEGNPLIEKRFMTSWLNTLSQHYKHHLTQLMSNKE